MRCITSNSIDLPPGRLPSERTQSKSQEKLVWGVVQKLTWLGSVSVEDREQLGWWENRSWLLVEAAAAGCGLPVRTS